MPQDRKRTVPVSKTNEIANLKVEIDSKNARIRGLSEVNAQQLSRLIHQDALLVRLRAVMRKIHTDEYTYGKKIGELADLLRG